ncbi:MAG: hypothetical protein WAP03_27850 [Methylorubrum rhodinum]|uniref:hypothetical protein n=1 Tax=Methylorubrum rhodinum TaxID=29428 RepID=UPI003BAF6FE5
MLDGFELVRLEPMPVLKVSRGRGEKRDIDAHSLWFLLSDLSDSVVWIEHVWGREGQSAGAGFQFGKAAGAPEHLCIAGGIRHELVTPQRWKRGLRIGSGKDDARAAAMRLWPAWAGEFRRRRADFAEAALIAEYGRRQEGAGNVFD